MYSKNLKRFLTQVQNYCPAPEGKVFLIFRCSEMYFIDKDMQVRKSNLLVLLFSLHISDHDSG